MNDKSKRNDVVVFSHLRWGFVYQRPQHLISRLSKNRKVLFIEEPIGYDQSAKGTFDSYKDGNIKIIQPKIDRSQLIEELTPILQAELKKLNDPIFWFYSPEFVEITNVFHSPLIIYDCMDQLTAFKGAPAELISQEKVLLEIADIVFTGGKSIYEEKMKHNKNTYCFPSSVDQKHFEKANNLLTKVPDDIKDINKPVVGYYGVIDERIDIDLLSQASKKMPEVSFVMIGPVAKIDQNDLPKNKNIYYLGSKDYKLLPNYLKKFDIAMMPFALNKHTQFISPTKTLEYMAAGKPIISTPIYDVKRDYSGVLDLVNNTDEFEASIKKYTEESKSMKSKRLAKFKKILKNTSWDKTAKSMEEIMEEKLNSFEYKYRKESSLPLLELQMKKLFK